MKTILVVYTNIKLNNKQAQTMKRYAFNTRRLVEFGTMISSDDYTTSMQVVEVFPISYKYVNTFTGELSNKRIASTKQFEIRELAEKAKAQSVCLCNFD